MINKRTMAIAYKLLGAFEISGLTLENDSGLKLLSDTSLTVVENANIAGIINAEGGDFLATTDAEFVGDRVRLSASDGSQMAIAAPTYSSSGLNFTTPIMSADGVGTILDLSTITSLDTSFNDGSGITSSHEITATQGGLVDLSGVVTISPPERREDYLQLILQDADSTIDLSSLETISGFGGGTIFGLSNEASLTLPSVEILEDVQFVLVDGATFSLGTSPVTYSSIGLNFGSFALMVADGMETELDLSAMTCLDASFDDGTGFINTHEISATNGGQIDLSGYELLFN